MKTIKIVKIIKGFDNVYEKFFPINLITKTITRNDNTQGIFSVNNFCWNINSLSCVELKDSTPREQFLFYLNYEKPFVLKEK